MKRTPILTAITVAAAAALAFASAGTAKASSPGYGFLCVKNTVYCAYSNGLNNTVGSLSYISTINSSGEYMTNWYYPISGSGYGVIQQANTNLCMEVTSSSLVVGVSCNPNSGDDTWKVVDYDSSNGVGDLQSVGHPTWCLTDSGNPTLSNGNFITQACQNVLDQQFVVG